MKKIISSALILALSIGAAQAQTEKGHKKGHQKERSMRGGAGMEQLGLTADQKSRLEAIRTQHKQEMEALKSNKSLSAEQSKTQRMELHKKFRAQYEAVLTPEQRQQSQKMLEQRRATGQFSRGEGHARTKGAGFSRGGNLRDLNLTADQQQKMKALQAEYKAKADAIRNNQSLSTDQKKAQHTALKASKKEQMKALLTQEQIEKMGNKKGRKENKNKKERSSKNL